MVRAAKRPHPGGNRAQLIADDGVNECRLPALALVERGQDRGQTPCEHALSRAGRPHEQHTVPPGRGNGECPHRRLLADDVRVVELSARGVRGDDARTRKPVRAQPGEVVEAQVLELPELGHARRDRSTQKAHVLALGLERVGEQAGNVAHVANERELARDEAVVEGLARYLPGRDEVGKGDGQVVARTDFPHRGGRQVDDDVLVSRHRKPRCPHGAFHAQARLLYRTVRHADNVHAGKPRPDLDLNRHGNGDDAKKRTATHARAHRLNGSH